MKIGIIGNGFVGRATQIFAKNYFAQDSIDNNNVERFEVLPDTVTTPAKPNSVMTYPAEAQDAAPPHHTAQVTDVTHEPNVVTAVGGRNLLTAVGGRNPRRNPRRTPPAIVHLSTTAPYNAEYS
jgi:hypothetical protein